MPILPEQDKEMMSTERAMITVNKGAKYYNAAVQREGQGRSTEVSK